MAGPLLETKLHVPRRRRGLVARPRLSALLDRGDEAALTLVSAPAGFGKTTVLADWLTSDPAKQRAVAWLSLDHRDNDPALFWAYLVGALRKAVPTVGTEALALLQTPQSSTEDILSTLVNDLSSIPADLALVLDDYHVIESSAVEGGMAFLVEHLPAQVHLVIAGRADPALPLARLRGRGALVELRTADLRFTPDEAAAYLTGVMGLRLTARDVDALDERTEGWVAALQLAGLSMQGRDDVSGFIGRFTGDDRYIVDYLVEEVLQRQSAAVRGFLLQTSILSRLTGPLCDAVTGRDDGKEMLEALDRGNLFVVPLDDRRRWYRYHHLFADVLQVRLLDERPESVADLHRRAGSWHEGEGDRAEAVRHALAGGDTERAADLVELSLPALQQSRQEATVRRWLEALPEEVIKARPVLSVGYAAALMVSGETTGVEGRLRDAERWLTTTAEDGQESRPSGPMVVVDDDGFRRVPRAISMYRAALALLSGDVAGTVTHARRTLDLAGGDDHLGRGSAAGLLGLAHWTSGDLDAGYRWYAEAAAELEKAGHLSDVSGCAIALADIRLTQGRLGEALSTFARTLRLVDSETGSVLRGAADMHVGIAGVLVERGDLDGARRHLAMSDDLGQHAGMPQNPYRWRVVMARIREIEGDVDSALRLLEEAERRYVGDYFPQVRPIPALRARLHARQGRWAEALPWVQERGLSIEDEADYLREFEQLTLARVLLTHQAAEGAEGPGTAVLALLDRLLQAAEDGGRTGSVIEVLAVQALAAQARGDMAAALAALRRALTLAEPQSYIRVILDEGRPMVALLRAVAAEGTATSYARRLLTVLQTDGDSAPVPARLLDPLSARELDVLRLLGTDLDGPDIARELFVSVNTVRTHTKNIYAKLGVNNRRAAVRRGEELDLLSRPAIRPGRATIVTHN